jgi:cytochrome c-type biogenesis protein
VPRSLRAPYNLPWVADRTASDTTRAGRLLLSGREVLASLSVLLALGLAIAAASVDFASLGWAISGASADVTAALRVVSAGLPLGVAFAAGMAAAVNPCGFALLPSYLGLYLGRETLTARTVWPTLLGRGLIVSAVMTASFVVLFGAAGVVVGGLSVATGAALPWVSLAVGVLLAVAGGHVLAGGELGVGATARLAAPLTTTTRRSGVTAYAAYGVAFGLTSLSCALPLFLAVVGSALSTAGFAAVLGQLVLFGLGMGTVITALTLVLALFGGMVLPRIGAVSRVVQPLSGVLLLASGAYVVYYWLNAGGLLRSMLLGP